MHSKKRIRKGDLIIFAKKRDSEREKEKRKKEEKRVKVLKKDFHCVIKI